MALLQDVHRQQRQIQHSLQQITKPLQQSSLINLQTTPIQPDHSPIILLLSLALFLAQYAIAWSVCFRRWRGSKRLRACSCSISFIHSTVAAAFAARDLLTTPWHLDAPNTNLQNKTMEWSIAFFTVDLLHYAAASPSDHLFIAHHLATLTYILSCRFFAHSGGKSVMCLLAAGEMTTPLQAVWTIALLRREESRLAERVYSVLSPVFTLAFTLCRGLLGPYLVWELFKFYVMSGQKHRVPRWLAVLWTVKVAAGVAGSFVWGCRLWRGLLKFYLQRLRIFRSSRGRRQD